MPKAYRPITLFKILLKGMERAINWLLGERVVALALPNQHTYTRGLGTETALFSFSDPVESVFHRGYLTACRKLHFIIPTFLVQPGTNEKTALLFLKILHTERVFAMLFSVTRPQSRYQTRRAKSF